MLIMRSYTKGRSYYAGLDIDREKKKKKDWQAYQDREMTFDIEEAGFKFQPTDIDATFGLAD